MPDFPSPTTPVSFTDMIAPVEAAVPYCAAAAALSAMTAGPSTSASTAFASTAAWIRGNSCSPKASGLNAC